MPRLHLVTGHREINRSDSPQLIYLGHDADAARTAQAAAIANGQVLIAERYNPTGPVTRYGEKQSLQLLTVAESAKPIDEPVIEKTDEPVIEETDEPVIEETAELLVAEEAPKAKKAK